MQIAVRVCDEEKNTLKSGTSYDIQAKYVEINK